MKLNLFVSLLQAMQPNKLDNTKKAVDNDNINDRTVITLNAVINSNLTSDGRLMQRTV